MGIEVVPANPGRLGVLPSEEQLTARPIVEFDGAEGLLPWAAKRVGKIPSRRQIPRQFPIGESRQQDA